MHWISLYDCVLFALLLFHVFRPTDSHVNPSVLLTGFILKEVVLANPLVVTRLLVLAISVIQVYVILPLARLWKHYSRNRTTTANTAGVQITCIHNNTQDHQVSTSANVVCPNCNLYRVQYVYRDKKYSMLLPATQPPRHMIDKYVKHIPTATTAWMWGPPCSVKAMWLVSDPQHERILDIMPTVLEILGPEKDGHARLSQGDSLRVKPLSWLTSSRAPAQCYDFEVEFHTGKVAFHRIKATSFTVQDLVSMCVKGAAKEIKK